MGFDFMLDSDLQLSLIECNTNPCLETQTSILLQRIIPQLLDQTFKIAVDPFLKANEQQFANAPEISVSEIKYELIYEHKFDENKKEQKVIHEESEDDDERICELLLG